MGNIPQIPCGKPETRRWIHLVRLLFCRLRFKEGELSIIALGYIGIEV